MTRGRVVGITAALVEVDLDVTVGAVVAKMMLESGVKAVAESVPVGLMVFVGGTELVSLSVEVGVTIGVVVLATNGVTTGVVSGVIVGVVVGGNSTVELVVIGG